MKINFAALSMPEKGSVVLLIAENRKMGKLTGQLDSRSGGVLNRAMDVAGFTGKEKSFLEIVAPEGLGNSRLLLAGIGKADKLDKTGIELLGGEILGKLGSKFEKTAAVFVEDIEGAAVDSSQFSAHLAFGAKLRSYRFDKYKSRKKDKHKGLVSLSLRCEHSATARKAFKALDAVADGVFLARDLVNEPANTLYPASFARRCEALKTSGLKVEVLGEKAMGKLGMHALLGVGQGSRRGSRLVVMRWSGAGKGEPVHAFVGKGVTFDTGGISLKPGAGMGDMKGDMGGAAAVSGLMLALAGRKAKINAAGVIGLVENMPDGRAQRPGDVVTSMSGQTIEILNTDAEGRLVLCDALSYVIDRFKPEFVINLATLTGAILVALGKEHAGLFSNNDQLAENLSAAGLASGEKLWRLPLGSAYDKMIDSKIADMKNIGGRFAGSITAAQFLQRFVGKTPWAHLDIAGTAMDSPKTAISQSWASGFGVRLLDQLVQDHYE